MFFSLLVFSVILQRNQDKLNNLLDEQVKVTIRLCEQRRLNTLKTNSTWDQLAANEARNPAADPLVRDNRVRIYKNAKLEVPVCPQ
jgi:hypothetical protein